MRLPRVAVLLLLGFTAAACADLSAVRDFAKTSSAVAKEQEAVLERWPDVYNKAIPQAAASWVSTQRPDLLNDLKKGKEIAEKRVTLAQDASKALKLYFDTLTTLADDKLSDVSSEASEISSNLTKLGIS